MWFEIRFIKRLLNTLKDVGFKRIFLRLRHEIIHLLDKNLPLKLTWFFIRKENTSPKFKKLNLITNLKTCNKKYLNKNDLKIKFVFLNKIIKLEKLIYWNDKNWSRLFSCNKWLRHIKKIYIY